MDKLVEDSMDLSIDSERKVARTFTGRIEWEMIAIGLGQFSAWIITWVLVVQGVIPLFVGFLIALFTACNAYLPSHAGQHSHLSGGRRNLLWLDSLVGQISVIPLAQSHAVLKATHMKHHAYTNDPQKDVDYDVASSKSLLEVFVRTNQSTAKYDKHLEVFKDDKNFVKSFEKGALVGLSYRGSLMVLVFFFPLEALFLWWLPSKIGVLYLSTFFSWYPHYQMDIGRYKDTRFWHHLLPRYINHSMQLHFVHHLHPGIGHYDEPKAIEALKPFLIEKGVPGAEEIPDRVSYNPLIKL